METRNRSNRREEVGNFSRAKNGNLLASVATIRLNPWLVNFRKI